MSAPDPAFDLLVERFLDGSIATEERARLAAMVRDDAARREELHRQVADSLRLQTTLSAFDAEDTWQRVRLVIARNTGSQRIRSADAVQARLRAAAAAATTNRRPSRRSARVSARASARFTRRRRSLPLAPLIGGLAAAACLLIAVWLIGARPEPTMSPSSLARLDGVQGEVRIVRDGSVSAGAAGAPLAAGDRVRVGSGRAAVVTARGDAIDLAAGAELALVDARTARLDAGTLTAHVVPRAAGDGVAFRTPHATAEILGTTFTLDVTTPRTRLDVATGKVRLRRAADGSSVVVATGEWAQAGHGLELVALPRGAAPPTPEPTPPAQPSGPAVVSFAIVDGATGRPVPGYEDLRDGATVQRGRLPAHATVFARTRPEVVGRVTFAVDGDRGIPDQRTPPYSFTRYDGKAYAALPMPIGELTLEAWAHADARGPAIPGSALKVTVRVVE